MKIILKCSNLDQKLVLLTILTGVGMARYFSEGVVVCLFCGKLAPSKILKVKKLQDNFLLKNFRLPQHWKGAILAPMEYGQRVQKSTHLLN